MLSGNNSFVRKVENGRLAWYRRAATAAFWDEHWVANISEELYRKAEQGELCYFKEVFTKYLPTSGRILEAGCGPGQIVLALRVMGYEVEGVEWANETVKSAKFLRPDLPISVGDVTRLDVPDGYYSGYISLGVIEYSYGGPDLFLKEAWRVLRHDGVAMISVPYFHFVRKVKALLGLYRDQHAGLEFYQYAFTESELANLLRRAGFDVLDFYHYDEITGFHAEISQLQNLYGLPFVGWRLNQWLQKHAQWVERHYGHMTMAICRKSERF